MTARHFPFATAALTVLLSLPAPRVAAADPAGVKAFDTWTATCNNLAECVVIGAQDGELLTVRVARGPAAADEPSVKISLVRADDDKAPVSTARLAVVEGARRTVLEVPKFRVSPDDDRFVIVELPPAAPGRGFVEATRNAASLTFEIGTAKGSFPLKGMSAALRWIDERQGRAGTTTALVAKGAAPAERVPAPRPPPEVTTAPAGSATEMTKPFATAALRRAMPKGDACDAELLQAPEEAEAPSAWKLDADRLLVFMPCTRGAYNFGSALFFTDAKGGSPRPVPLPYPAGPRDGPRNILVNPSFDPAKMELSEFNKGRGLGDCGSQTTWVWTGQAFALLDASAQDTCAGLLADEWPNLYRAVKK